MTSRTLFIIIVVTLVLIAGSIVAGNFIHFTTPPFQVTANSTSTSAPAPQPVTLALGSRNVMVGVVQQALIKQGYLQGSSTGVYDTSTQAAVKKFQEAHRVPQTGVIDEATFAAMNGK